VPPNDPIAAVDITVAEQGLSTPTDTPDDDQPLALVDADDTARAELEQLEAVVRRSADRANAPGQTLRAALKSLGPLVTDPSALPFLVEPPALEQWRVLRDHEPLRSPCMSMRFGGGTVRTLPRLLTKLIGGPGEHVGSGNGDPLPGYAASSIWDAYEPPRYITKNILAPGTLTTVFGQSGHLKSAAAIDLAFCIGSGKDFHGLRTPRRRGVGYIAGEGHGGLKKRGKAWLLKHAYTSTDEPPAVFITSQGADLVGNPERLRATMKHAEGVLGVPVEVVVIDTLAANFGAGDENLTRDMNLALAHCRAAVGPEVAILVVHHTGHLNPDRERGAYLLIASADVRIQASYDQTSKLLELRWLKVKDDEIPEPLTFECRQVNLGWHDEEGEELTSVVLERLEGASLPRATPRLTGLGKNQETALKALRTLYARARRNLEEQNRDPAEALILIDGWRNALGQKGIARNRFHDLIKDLQERHLIAVDDPHVRLVEVTP